MADNPTGEARALEPLEPMIAAIAALPGYTRRRNGLWEIDSGDLEAACRAYVSAMGAAREPGEPSEAARAEHLSMFLRLFNADEVRPIANILHHALKAAYAIDGLRPSPVPSEPSATGPGSVPWRFNALMDELLKRFPDPEPISAQPQETRILAAIDGVRPSGVERDEVERIARLTLEVAIDDTHGWVSLDDDEKEAIVARVLSQREAEET